MGMQHVQPIIENDNRRAIQHETFGHLFPKKNKIFIGTIYLARSDYRDDVILKDNSTVPSSPWWFASLNDFANDFLSKKDSPGTVYKIQVRCQVVKDGDGETIKITDIGHKAIEIE